MRRTIILLVTSLILVRSLCVGQEKKLHFGIISSVREVVNQLKIRKEELSKEEEELSNQPPILYYLNADPGTVVCNSTSVITAVAGDWDRDILFYYWQATGGTISGSGSEVIWTAPSSTGNYIISCVVYDGKEKSNQKSITLYVTTGEGTKKWEFLTGGAVRSSPAIGEDSTIYIGSNDGKLYAINPDGTKKWEFLTGGGIESSPAIGEDGTIYFGSDDQKLYAVNPDGTKKWEFFAGGEPSSPVIGSDGTIYIGFTYYISSSMDGKLYAINPDGTKKWEFSTVGGIGLSSAIDANDVIYVCSFDMSFDVGGNGLYAINPDGTKKWSFESTHWDWFDSYPVIGADGRIYVGSFALQAGGGCDSWFYAIEPNNGYFIWKVRFAEDLFGSACKPAISSDGIIYVPTRWGLYAIDPNREIKNEEDRIRWRFYASCGMSSPAIGPDGTIYVGGRDGKLYAVRGSGTLADTPWPMFMHDLRHTGRKK